MIELFVISVMVVFCYMGAIIKLTKRPICYKYVYLKPNKSFSLSQFCIFEGKGINLIVISNYGIFFVWRKNSLKLNIVLDDIKQKSICNITNYIAKYTNSYYRIGKNDITFYGHGKVCFEFAKPNCDYKIDRNAKTFCLDKKYLFQFKNFKTMDIKQNNNICIKVGFNGEAKIDFVSFGLKVTQSTRTATLKNYFGFYDTNQWEIVPDFSTKKLVNNLLKSKYIQKLLSPQNKIINLPIYTSDSTIINLTKMGFSKLIKISQSKNKITILDLLANFDCIVYNVSRFCRYAMFGEDFLCLKGSNVNIEFSPDIINNKFLDCNLICGEDIDYRKSHNLENFLHNINRLILHGVKFDIKKLLQKLNIIFLNEKIKLILGNLLLNYATIFQQATVFFNSKVYKLLLENINIAIKSNNITAYNFLKKVLPFIKKETLYNQIFEKILKLRKNIKNIDYEYALNERLGLRLVGNLLYFSIPFEKQLNCMVWFSGHKIIIKKPQNTQKIKLDGIIYTGFKYINLNNCDASVFIEFVD